MTNLESKLNQMSWTATSREGPVPLVGEEKRTAAARGFRQSDTIVIGVGVGVKDQPSQST